MRSRNRQSRSVLQPTGSLRRFRTNSVTISPLPTKSPSYLAIKSTDRNEWWSKRFVTGAAALVSSCNATHPQVPGGTTPQPRIASPGMSDHPSSRKLGERSHNCRAIISCRILFPISRARKDLSKPIHVLSQRSEMVFTARPASLYLLTPPAHASYYSGKLRKYSRI
jgi:hypothetical protein